MAINLTTPRFISGFEFLVDKKPTTAVVNDIFAVDLNGDGVEEAIFLGRQTQPATISTWSNSSVHIFQVNTSGAWVETTNTLLPDNVIQGTEPNLLVGDFNNDGKVDFFIPAGTDMEYRVPSYLFLNTGSSFTKKAFDFQTWAHGAFVADVDKDGYLDVLNTDYGNRTGIGFGGPTGFDYKSTDWRGTFGGSGISAADFLGDGSVTILVSDDWAVNGAAALYKWSLDATGALTFKLLSALPTPRFDQLSKWAPYNFGNGQGGASHDVRIVPFDFSGDGLMDAIEMSRPSQTNEIWPEYSEIQFLLNKGNGVFEDVTGSKLLGYDNATSASYQPVFFDINGDGRTDIFISSADNSKYNSTAVLLQQANGTFIESGRDAFSNLYMSAVSSVQSANLGYVFTDWGQTMQLLKGANGKISVLSSVCYINAQGGMSNLVFSSELSFTDMAINEHITGTTGNDRFDGGTGTDTAHYSTNATNYTISKAAVNGVTTYTVNDKTRAEDSDTLTNVERLQFADKTIALDIDANAGQAYRLYQAAFDRTPDQSGLSFWVRVLDASALNLEQVSGEFLRSAEFSSLYGSGASNAILLGLLYRNVLNREADAGGRDYWLSQLDAGMQREQLLINFSESTENQANVIGVIQNGITLDLV